MSPPLTAIFGIPPATPIVGRDGKAVNVEGTEDNPIVLSGVTSAQLDDFLAFFFKSELPDAEKCLDPTPDRSEEIGVNLLTVGCLWDIKEAKSHAKQLLEGLKLPPLRILQLAREFAVYEWVEAAVKELIPMCSTAKGTFNSDDVLKLGPTTLSILFQAKCAIEYERQCIAYVAPKLPPHDTLNYGDCSNHQSCEHAWKDAWWLHVAKRILHPGNPMPLKDIGAHLHGLNIRGMTQKCHDEAVNQWTANVFEEESLVASAVAGVLRFHKACQLS
ncbi:hypothetical protein B0H17DRAFT_1190415 [Mycena rosella]|uniref:BTB domain-containing protein n=1 Tax=Mycena rosella TaxID=1033263 RepID=A0AAD7MCR2_MYCRO|nr:hypothetical protein B0H17DRAFT_1190415 [Mycena rosella]